MFQALINDAKAAAGSLIAKYLARASVAVPFLTASGFATAAVTFLLVERFGAIAACWIVAAGFTVIGVVAAFLVTIKEQDELAETEQAEQEGVASDALDAAAQVVSQTPMQLVSALLSTPMGAGALAAGARSMGRNLPVMVLIGVIGALLWAEDADTGAPRPNGMDGLRPEPPQPGWHQ